MIIKNKMSVLINQDSFLIHHYHIFLGKIQKESISAYDVNFKNLRNHSISAIGEYLERERLANNQPLKDNYVLGTNLIDGKVERFLTKDFLFGEKFLDSCGMASHFYSQNAIAKAYLEFFERQSFIANYLYGIPGQKISYTGINEIERLDKYIKNYVTDTRYYNISLSETIKVIIAICWSESRKAVGIGTSLDTKEAVIRAQEEVLQYFAADRRKIDSREKKTKSADIYLNKFNEFSTSQMLENFHHLFISRQEINVENTTIKPDNVNFNNIMYENYVHLRMKPFIIMFPSREELSVKVVKVFDNNWFPHMRPGLYEAEKIKNIGKLLNRERVNFSEWIPFA